MSQKGTDGIGKSVDPDQTIERSGFAVFSDLPVKLHLEF